MVTVFHNLTIKQRLLVIILAVSLMVTICLFTFFLLLSMNRAKKSLFRETALVTSLVTENCVIPLVFNDREAGNKVLQTLAPLNTIQSAYLFDTTMTLFASFGNDTLPLDFKLFTDADTVSLMHDMIISSQKAVHDSQTYGQLVIVSSTETLKKSLAHSIKMLVILLGGATLLAVGAALRLQKNISQPIIDLTNVADQITVQQDYSLRIPRTTGGEIGKLQASINTMVSRLQKSLIDLHEEMRQRQKQVHEKEMLKEQLQQAERLKALGRMAGGIARDFNNHLVGIMGYASFLCTKLTSDIKLRRFAEKILQASREYSELINKMLLFSRHRRYDLQPFSIDDLVKEVIPIIKMSLPATVTLATDLAGSTRTAMIDKTRMQNAILNLAINSRDAMPSGGVLSFHTQFLEHVEREEQPELSGPHIILSVSDTGTGIDQVTQKHIFEPFFTTKEAGKGTGLGLSSVYGTVCAHGGRISVHSLAGQGTKFTIEIPLSGIRTPLSANSGQYNDFDTTPPFTKSKEIPV